ncbi:hypothetical protein [uncultured Peptostreptococcus sp.]|jgi:hypothetical protein|nr:hypothetical protein [uncultured Peptostreptococcus sp.]
MVSPKITNIPSNPLYVSMNVEVAPIIKNKSEVHFNKVTTLDEKGLSFI